MDNLFNRLSKIFLACRLLGQMFLDWLVSSVYWRVHNNISTFWLEEWVPALNFYTMVRYGSGLRSKNVSTTVYPIPYAWDLNVSTQSLNFKQSKKVGKEIFRNIINACFFCDTSPRKWDKNARTVDESNVYLSIIESIIYYQLFLVLVNNLFTLLNLLFPCRLPSFLGS